MDQDLERPNDPDCRSLNDQVREIWERNAGFWDDYMGDAGNEFHRELVAPSALRLLALSPEESVLEIACGAGLFARQMAEAGAKVLATDFCAAFLERANVRCAAFADRIVLRQVDATDEGALLDLGEGRFDAAVANMALMDMAEIDPLLCALRRLLKPNGRFVFTIMHPCFNGAECTRLIEQSDAGGVFRTTYGVKVTRYAACRPELGVGIVDQPAPHYYFHRSLSDLFGACFRAGFVIDGLEEPRFLLPDAPSVTSMRNFTEFPFVLSARLRPT